MMMRKQGGKGVVSSLMLNFNLTGHKQFQPSVDRIDPININYWDWDNLQLVCLALNVMDCSRCKKYVTYKVRFTIRHAGDDQK